MQMMKTFTKTCVVNHTPRATYKNRCIVRVKNTFKDDGEKQSHKNRKSLIERRDFLKEQLSVSFEKMYHLCKKEKRITDNENTDCRVVWDEIEEVSCKLNDIQTELAEFYECWDDVSCLEYDI
tara:strand:+ start:420 stop:788 length:369 start_codon:yes stop_codon:yes gene_type:complete